MYLQNTLNTHQKNIVSVVSALKYWDFQEKNHNPPLVEFKNV